MTRALKLIAACAILALAPAMAWAAAGGTGIAGTAHDFSGIGNPATGLCTFCHTPHRAISTQLLWNHTLSQNNFSWDVPATTAGTTFPTISGQTYTGPTTKCLSCHDGSVAVGDIAWWNEGAPGAPLDNTMHAWPDAFNIGARDGVPGSMKGNHPVAMPYPYQQLKNTYNGVTTGDAIVLGEWQSNPTTLNIRLFNDNNGSIEAGPVALKTGIECSSCHDPHNKASVDDLFLRGTLGGNNTDYICLKCHVK